MQKLSGLLIDLYDDDRHTVFRELFPSRDLVPELVKQAHLLTHEERVALPDNLFALVLVDEEATLRKFACIDPAHTLLSLLYFDRLEKVGGVLPEVAMARARENLKIATQWYWDSPEALEKSAGIGGAVLGGLGRLGASAMKNPGKALSTGMATLGAVGAAKQIGGNLRNVNAAEQAAGGFGNIVG